MSRNAKDEEAKRRVCTAYTEALKRGKNIEQVIGWLAEIEEVGRPAIWKRLRAGGIVSPYKKGGSGGRPRAPSILPRYKKQDSGNRRMGSLPPVVSRDPCPRCGVRGDIACGHSKAPLGMML